MQWISSEIKLKKCHCTRLNPKLYSGAYYISGANTNNNRKYGDPDRSVRCSIAQRGWVGKTLGEKRKRSEKGKEKAEQTSDEEPLVKKAKVTKVVAEDTPLVPEFASGEVEDKVEGEAEQPRVVEGLGQGAREARPDEAALVVALRELTEVCR